MSTQTKLQAAIAEMAEHGYDFVIDTTSLTRGDAWCRQVEIHGRDLALMHAHEMFWNRGELFCFGTSHHDSPTMPATELMISFPYDAPEVAWRLIAALQAQGFTPGWTGEVEDCVHVRLDWGWQAQHALQAVEYFESTKGQRANANMLLGSTKLPQGVLSGSALQAAVRLGLLVETDWLAGKSQAFGGCRTVFVRPTVPGIGVKSAEWLAYEERTARGDRRVANRADFQLK